MTNQNEALLSISSEGIKFNTKKDDTVKLKGDKILMKGTEQRAQGGYISVSAREGQIVEDNDIAAEEGGEIKIESEGEQIVKNNRLDAKSKGKITVSKRKRIGLGLLGTAAAIVTLWNFFLG